MFFKDIGTENVIQGDSTHIRNLELHLAAAAENIAYDRSPSVLARIDSRGRLTAQQRIELLCDSDAPIWPLGDFQTWAAENKRSTRLGAACVFAVVCSRACIVIANDNTVAAGSWWPGTPEKIQRAQEMAFRLHIPVIYLVECAGLYLAAQDKTYAGHTGAGAIFETQARLNRAGITQLAAVFGDCIAGGGYMPLLCDKIAMTEQAAICIGGSELNKNAHGRADVRLGAPNIHVHQSGCAEYRVADDKAAVKWLRNQFDLLPTSAVNFYRIADSVEPPFPIEDLYDILPFDTSRPYDANEVLARIADGAQVQPLMPDVGVEINACLALIDGLPCICISNAAKSAVDPSGRLKSGGILYLEGIEKMRKIVMAAHDDGIPVIWIQDVSGFDIGEEAERLGLLKHGAALLREQSKDNFDIPPDMTIVLRKAAGAGYYAMKGAPFHPAWTLATALTQLEVMRPAILAATMYDKKIERCTDNETRRKLQSSRDSVIAEQTEASLPESALRRGDLDTFVPLSELRKAIISFIRAAWQTSSRPSAPPRLWSVLNL